MNRRLAKQIARHRAGMILESVINAGWWPEELEDRYGEDGVEMISQEIMAIALRLAPVGLEVGAADASN